MKIIKRLSGSVPSGRVLQGITDQKSPGEAAFETSFYHSTDEEALRDSKHILSAES